MKILLALLLGSAALTLQAADFTPLDRATARHLTDPASHKEPTIVALWSTECVYCKTNLKLLGKISRRGKAPRIVTVAAEPELPGSRALLDAHGIRGAHYAYGTDTPEAIAYAIDPDWHGELPRTLLFDGRGGRKIISGRLEEATLRRALAGSSKLD